MKFQYRLRSFLILGTLFSLLFAVFWVVSYYYWGLSELVIAGISLAIIFFQYLISPLIIGWIYNIHWISPQDVAHYHPNIAQIIDQVITKYGIDPTKFGVIHDKSPNAFTFGWTKNSARIVITDGILDLLDSEEQKAVVGHELGHVIHNDFIVMTLASAIPILFYTLFRVLIYSRSSRRRSSSNNEGGGEAIRLGLAALSWIMYIVGTLVMLLLSRIREYWADDFSARENQNANALSTGLVKIAYGILQKPESARSGGGGSSNYTYRRRGSNSKNRVQFIKGLGISDKSSAKNLIYSAGGSKNRNRTINNNIIAKSAAWDLYTPWAKYFNVFSTHPLPAKRIKRLNEVSEKDLGIQPEIDLTPARKEFEKQMGKSGWDEFIYEVIVQYMPKLIFFGWLIAGLVLWGTGFDFTGIPLIPFNNALAFLAFSFVMAGLLQLLQNLVKYDSNFKRHNILDLVTTINVSPVKPVPAVVRGNVLGRGAPGLFWSEDVFIRDKHGMLYIDYDYGIGFINTLFGIFKTRDMVGRNVEVMGWYRRGPRPYLQVHTIKLLDSGKTFHCRKKLIWQIIGFVLVILGAVIWFYANGF